MQRQRRQELVLDANVLVAGLLQPEELSDIPSDEAERQYMLAEPYIAGLGSGEYRLHLPRICVVETCAAVRRRAKNNPEARAVGIKRTFHDWSIAGYIVLYDMDESSMDAAVDAAINYSTRGMDSIYIALAESLSIPLKTFDEDVLQKYPNASQP